MEDLLDACVAACFLLVIGEFIVVVAVVAVNVAIGVVAIVVFDVIVGVVIVVFIVDKK